MRHKLTFGQTSHLALQAKNMECLSDAQKQVVLERAAAICCGEIGVAPHA